MCYSLKCTQFLINPGNIIMSCNCDKFPVMAPPMLPLHEYAVKFGWFRFYPTSSRCFKSTVIEWFTAHSIFNIHTIGLQNYSPTWQQAQSDSRKPTEITMFSYSTSRIYITLQRTSLYKLFVFCQNLLQWWAWRKGKDDPRGRHMRDEGGSTSR